MFQYGIFNESYYGEYVRHWNVRNVRHIHISPLTKKQITSKNSFVTNHLLFYNPSTTYDDFSILTCERKTFLLELKESLIIIIIGGKPYFDRNITSAPVHIFKRP